MTVRDAMEILRKDAREIGMFDLVPIYAKAVARLESQERIDNVAAFILKKYGPK